MKSINFKAPTFTDLIPEIGNIKGIAMDKGFTESNRRIRTEVFEKVKEFHKTYGHPIGMIRWDKEEGPPGGLTKERTQLRTKLIKEALEELRSGCKKQSSGKVLDGIGHLGYVVLGTVVELGITVDVLLGTDMIEGAPTLGLRSIPKEVRQ